MGRQQEKTTEWILYVDDGDNRREVWRGDFKTAKMLLSERRYMFVTIDVDINFTVIDGLHIETVEGWRIILYPVYRWSSGMEMPVATWEYVLRGNGQEIKGNSSSKAECIKQIKTQLLKLLGF